MPIDSEQFLESYAKALNTFDPKQITRFCLPPTIVMGDTGKRVMANQDQLEQGVSWMMSKFEQLGIKKFVPRLQQTLRLSDTLFFSKMRWLLFDDNEQLLFGCALSYTLQKLPDQQLKIIVAVIDDTESKLADIFNFAE